MRNYFKSWISDHNKEKGSISAPLLLTSFVGLLPLHEHREELNTMGSYMCLLAQKSAETNWLARRSYWREFAGSSDLHGDFASVTLKVQQQDSGFESP